MNKNRFSGTFFVLVAGLSFAMTVLFSPKALSSMERPRMDDVVQGKWSPQFEKSLGKSLPIYDLSRNLWGNAEYRIFHQGRKGVLVGNKGWLFTDEEFSCPPHYQKNLTDNLAYIEDSRKALAARNVKLAVVVVPAKARIFPDYLADNRLPGCRVPLYGELQTFLKSQNIPVTDLASAMKAAPDRDGLYLKTDTHWTPAGAQLAAANVGRLVQQTFPDLSLAKGHFAVKSGPTESYDGDLRRYLPGIGADEVPADRINAYTMESSTEVADAGNSLFDDSYIPGVVLVGTSYSANKRWNFEGFLKEALQADILNAADEGMGPFTVMDKYLASTAWKSAPPQLLVWEIPERYLLMPHGVQN